MIANVFFFEVSTSDLFAEHTPHKRMKGNAVHLHVHIMRFVSHSCTNVDAALELSLYEGYHTFLGNFLETSENLYFLAICAAPSIC